MRGAECESLLLQANVIRLNQRALPVASSIVFECWR
jgi:hypothetical protein